MRLEAAGGGKLAQPTRPPPWLPQELGCFGAWVEARLSLKWEVIIRQGLGSSSVIDRVSTGSSRTSEAGGKGGPSVFCGWTRLPRHPLPCPQPGPGCLEVRGCEARREQGLRWGTQGGLPGTEAGQDWASVDRGRGPGQTEVSVDSSSASHHMCHPSSDDIKETARCQK